MAAASTDKLRKSYSFLTKSLASNIDSVATTIPLNNTTNVPTDTAVDFIIDRVDTNGTRTPTVRELCSGVVSGSNIINVTRGMHGTTAQSHTSGAVIEFIVSAMAQNDMVDQILVEHNQSGTHSTTLLTSRTEDTAPDPANDFVLTYDTSATALKKVKPDNLIRNNTQVTQGWITSLLPAVSSCTANGNHSYDVTFASTVASYLTPGMRLRLSRTVAAPTQCTSLNGTTQYYSKASPNKLTFTDDFVVSAWVKLTAYQASGGIIASRYNGTSGWQMSVGSTGQVSMAGYNAGSGNSSTVTSYQSIPLNKWVHVTCQLDMSTFTATTTTSYVMIDGVDVPAAVSRGGTNPTALIQAGNLEIGSWNGGLLPFGGKIAQVAIYSAKVTQATIKASMNQTLSGSETSLISAYSFNNSITDLNTTTPNDLTANGSAVATNADSPFALDATGTPGGTYEWGIVTKVSTTVATVQTPEGSAIPTTGGVSAVDMSTQKAPYGMPAQKGKWEVISTYVAGTGAVTISSLNQWFSLNLQLTVPLGEWIVGYEGPVQGTAATSITHMGTLLAPATPTNGTRSYELYCIGFNGNPGTNIIINANRKSAVPLTGATAYLLYGEVITNSGATTMQVPGTLGMFVIKAENAYL